MSFILDALKKSELERQRQTMPGLMDAGAVAKRPGLPRWAIALGLLLGINLVVLIVVLMRNTTPASSGAVSAAHVRTVPRSAAAAAPAPPDHFSPLDTPAAAPAHPDAAPKELTPDAAQDAPPVYAPEIPVDGGAEPAAAHEQGDRHPAKAVAPHHDPLLTDEGGSDNDEVLPSMSELNLTGANGLPEMHIDVHVFATRPSERFVYINMRKYREGATLQEGPVLERIRRDGVVLNYHGLRFILPRQ